MFYTFKKGVTLALLLLSSTLAIAEDIFEVSTKEGEYNEVLLTQPFVDALFNNKDAIDGKIIVVNNNKNFMFKLKPEIEKDLQLFIVLRDGTRKKIRLIPNSDINGQTWPKEAVASNSEIDLLSFETNKNKNYFVSILKEVYEGEASKTGSIPGGFSVEPADDVAYYGPLLIREVKRFSNSMHRVSVYALSSKNPINVTPADFYRDDVIAIELNHDVVSPEEVLMVVISKEGGSNGKE